MSQIRKVTAFLKNDLPDLHKKAGEIHELATAVKGRAVGLLDHIHGEFSDLDKELVELQAALGITTNGPPVEDPLPALSTLSRPPLAEPTRGRDDAAADHTD